MPDNPSTQKKTMYEVEAKSVHHIREPGIYNANLHVKGLYHMCTADCLKQFG